MKRYIIYQNAENKRQNPQPYLRYLHQAPMHILPILKMLETEKLSNTVQRTVLKMGVFLTYPAYHFHELTITGYLHKIYIHKIKHTKILIQKSYLSAPSVVTLGMKIIPYRVSFSLPIIQGIIPDHTQIDRTNWT